MLEDKVVLVVDDDISLSEMYHERIKAEGAIVLIAKDGVEALRVMKESLPQVVILDIMMPKMNGLEVLKEIKDDAELAAIPVIVLTALDDQEKRKIAAQYGAVEYVVKSEILPLDIVEKLEKVLAK